MADRPSDETTGKVVAKKAGWDKYNTTTAGRLHPLMVFHNGDMNAAQIPQVDPRDDPNAALELLGWLRNNTKANISMGERGFHLRTGSWRSAKTGMRATFGSVDDDSLAPYGGQPFRYAVVEFAAKVLGVG